MSQDRPRGTWVKPRYDPEQVQYPPEGGTAGEHDGADEQPPRAQPTWHGALPAGEGRPVRQDESGDARPGNVDRDRRKGEFRDDPSRPD